MKRHYLVTGATSGVGKAVAESLLSLGHSVVAVGRDWTRLIALYEGTAGAVPLQADLGAHDIGETGLRIQSFADKAAGGYDGIFHAAGAELVRPLRATSDDDYRRAMTFADSSFALLRAAASRDVMKTGGSIVIMSSVAAHRGTHGMAAYSSARAAVEAMARVAAIELSGRRIRVNCIAAGAFQTPMHDRVTSRMPETARDAYAAAHPLGIGPVEAVRDAVLHLLGPGSSWITGTVQVVDGGYLAR